MSFIDKLLGRPLTLKAQKKQQLSVMTGVPALGMDSLASTAYGPEAALTILLPLGVAGLQDFFYISLLVVFTLLCLYLSYQQTAAAYPGGGGAYIVASDNLGQKVGIWAAISLLLDYLLNVAVGISAGVGAIVSAIPSLHSHTLLLCLLVLLMLTILNLRGIRESGRVLVVPAVIFVVCISVTLLTGVVQSWLSSGHPSVVIPPPSPPPAKESWSLWLLFAAFANGLTAMTGVEAVSNAVPLFRKPSVKNAQRTLTVIVGILAIFLILLGYLCPYYNIVAMDESQPGYQTILSQLVGAITGRGVFYYIAITSIFVVLTYSAQTSFADFPRVCRLLAEDYYLPHFFAERGRRLVYSLGILLLAIFSAILLIVFKGITSNLIPLFAVGAFAAFLFSQIGMVRHWLKRPDEKHARLKLVINAIGGVVTATALTIIIVTKFMEGAWVVVIVAPVLALMLTGINRHYKRIAREVDHPLEIQVEKWQSPAVIIPIKGWDCVSERAIRFGLLISDDVTALHIISEKENEKRLRKLWAEKVEEPLKGTKIAMPHLKVVYSPYRRVYKPILSFIKNFKREKPGKLIAVVIPELVEAHWYEHLLHNVRATGLRTLLFLERDHQTVVITVPWYIREPR